MPSPSTIAIYFFYHLQQSKPPHPVRNANKHKHADATKPLHHLTHSVS